MVKHQLQIRPLNIRHKLFDETIRAKLESEFGKDFLSTELFGFALKDIDKKDLEQLRNYFDKIAINVHEENNSVEIYTGKLKLKQYFTDKKSKPEFEIASMLENVYANYEKYSSCSFFVGRRKYEMSKFHIMGILNVTPDSFSDGGKYYEIEAAVRRGVEMYDAGVDFIDIGGESTRPGAEMVSTKEEMRRVLPVIEGILRERPDAVISVDTTKSGIAASALDLGAKIVNDISGLTFDEKMIDVISAYDATVIIMHIKGTPQTMQLNPFYEDTIGEIYEFLSHQMQKAKNGGIENIIVDPGIGFGKRVKDNYEIIARLDEFKGLGAPLLIGLSRKSFLGKALDLPVEQRDYATLVTEQIAIENGAVIVRTHNYKKLIEARKINEYIQNPNSLELNNV